MTVELNWESMLTVAGVASWTWIWLRLVIRPWLQKQENNWWYPAAMNSTAIVVGWIGALLATLIPGFNYESVFNAVLLGLGGAVIAVGGNEIVGNMAKWYTDRKNGS